MNILITGSSSGIGKAVSKRFLGEGFTVYGIDRDPSDLTSDRYHHFLADMRFPETFPDLPSLDYLFLNAGTQNSEDDIDNNLKGTINVADRYAFREGLKAVLFNASASAHTGFEFPEYSASKAGILGYTKHLAWRLAEKGVLVNSISPGGVLTDSNKPVMEDPQAWEEIMKVTPLGKWMTEEEVTDWVYFLLVVNRSASGQDFLIDNGEKDLNCTFVWPHFSDRSAQKL